MSNKKIKKYTTLLSGLFILTLLIACSDEEITEKITFNHPHNVDINKKKHTFEHKFASQCVAREIKNSVNPKADKKRFDKPCLCIATRIMKNLTAVEAKKFLQEQKNTHSLKMSFDEAAYFCLQKTARPTPPSYSKKDMIKK